MIDYKYYIKKITMAAADAVVLDLANVKGGPVFNYKPGQYVMISYVNGKGRLERKHAFSLASSPTEKDQLRLGIRIMGNFTQGLLKLKPGHVIFVSGPFGSFVFDEKKYQDLVLIAGGIGITPFLSTLKYATDLKLSNQLALIYSNKTIAGTLFLQEINRLEKKNKNIKTLFSLTGERIQTPHDNVVYSRLNGTIINNFIGGVEGKTFFICGPAPFMQAVKNGLTGLGVFKAQIATEQFSMIMSQDYQLAIRNFSYAMGFSGLLMLISLYQIYNIAQAAPAYKAGNSLSNNLFGVSDSAVGTDTSSVGQNQAPTPTTSVSGVPINKNTIPSAAGRLNLAQPAGQTDKATAPEPATYVSPAKAVSSATSAKTQTTVKATPISTVPKVAPVQMTTTVPTPVTSASIPVETQPAPTTSAVSNTVVSAPAPAINNSTPAPAPVTSASAPTSVLTLTPTLAVSTLAPTPVPTGYRHNEDFEEYDD